MLMVDRWIDCTWKDDAPDLEVGCKSEKFRRKDWLFEAAFEAAFEAESRAFSMAAITMRRCLKAG